MKRTHGAFVLVLVTVLLSISCGFAGYVPVEINDIPFPTGDVPGDLAGDFETIVTSATELVLRELPSAILIAFQYKGTRSSLVTLDGVMYFDYTERRWGLDRELAVWATVTADRAEGFMSLRTSDPIPYYGRTQAISLTQGVGLSKIASLADQQIAYLGIGDCYVRLLYSGADWRTLCYPPGSDGLGEVLCDFRIDAMTGEATPD